MRWMWSLLLSSRKAIVHYLLLSFLGILAYCQGLAQPSSPRRCQTYPHLHFILLLTQHTSLSSSPSLYIDCFQHQSLSDLRIDFPASPIPGLLSLWIIRLLAWICIPQRQWFFVCTFWLFFSFFFSLFVNTLFCPLHPPIKPFLLHQLCLRLGLRFYP